MMKIIISLTVSYHLITTWGRFAGNFLRVDISKFILSLIIRTFVPD
jgi:hypothetical protein